MTAFSILFTKFENIQQTFVWTSCCHLLCLDYMLKKTAGVMIENITAVNSLFTFGISANCVVLMTRKC